MLRYFVIYGGQKLLKLLQKNPLINSLTFRYNDAKVNNTFIWDYVNMSPYPSRYINSQDMFYYTFINN